MSQDLDGLEAWIGETIKTLDPRSRRKLLGKIGQSLRRNTSRRMLAQIGPDGRKWAARKDGSRKKMFSRLRLARNLKTKSTADEVAIGFSGRTARIARVHHHGLRDAVTSRGVRVKYEAREMLGLSATDRGQVEAAVINWIKSE